MLHEDIANKLANEIIDELFQNGFKEQAERLVLMSPNGKDLGGWGKEAVQSLIRKILTNPMPFIKQDKSD